MALAALVTALTVLLGLQFLRVFLPSVTYVLGAGGLQPYVIGGYVLGTFGLGFAAPLLRRRIGARALLSLAAGGLAVLRVAEQLNRDPRFDLVLSTAAMPLFLWFFPALIAVLRQDGHAVGPLGTGLFLGLAGDAALRTALWTVDLSWQDGSGALAGAVAIAAAEILALAGTLSATVVGYVPPREHGADGPGSALWPLLVMGPVWFLEVEVFQNFGRLAELLGWSFPAAALWVQLSNGAAVVSYGVAQARLGRRGGPVVLLAGGFLVWLLAAMGEGGWPAWAAWPVGHAALALAVAAALALADAVEPTRRGLAWTSVWHGLGMVGFVVLAFGFYAFYNVFVLLPVAAGVAAALGALATLGLPHRSGTVVQFASPSASAPSRLGVSGGGPVLVVLLLAVLPGIQWFNWQPPAVPAAAWPGDVRVVTYNLHQGVDAFGAVALEEQARVLEASGADVIVLQEVTRGWLIDGGVDMLAWLSERLGMPAVFGPTLGDIWGNAVLTRLPVAAAEEGRFPLRESGIGRGYLLVTLDTAAGPLHVIATHLTHEEPFTASRQAEVQDLVRAWAGRPRTLIVGDLNAEPETPEITALLRAGFLDSWAEQGSGDGFTFPSTGPDRRIDYILHTPDLRVGEVGLLQSLASDHLPVAATVFGGP